MKYIEIKLEDLANAISEHIYELYKNENEIEEGVKRMSFDFATYYDYKYYNEWYGVDFIFHNKFDDRAIIIYLDMYGGGDCHVISINIFNSKLEMRDKIINLFESIYDFSYDHPIYIEYDDKTMQLRGDM